MPRPSGEPGPSCLVGRVWKRVQCAVVQARRVLEKIRGTADVDEEYADVLEKAQMAAKITNPWTLLLFHRKYRWAALYC